MEWRVTIQQLDRIGLWTGHKLVVASSMKILNLGCGVRTSDFAGVINIDWSIYLRLKRSALGQSLVPIVARGERREKFDSLPNNIMAHDLSKGIPFEDDSVDVVYNSHMLEHLDRHVAESFLEEAKRVLKPGGIHRIVVPDFEAACRAYLAHIDSCETSAEELAAHDEYIELLLEQSVRREGYGTSHQPPVRRFFENLLLGDARSRGETHQWMYDRFNLKAKLMATGYQSCSLQSYNTSLIPNWNEIGLDLTAEGNPYKPGSLYMEAVK